MEQGCPTGNVRYDSPQHAVKAKKRLARRSNAQPHKNLRHFCCSICHGWHLSLPSRKPAAFKSMRAKPGRYNRQ
jgi:hypothetical protein